MANRLKVIFVLASRLAIWAASVAQWQALPGDRHLGQEGASVPALWLKHAAQHWSQGRVRTVQPGFPDPQTRLPINPELRPWDHGFANDFAVSSGTFDSYKCLPLAWPYQSHYHLFPFAQVIRYICLWCPLFSHPDTSQYFKTLLHKSHTWWPQPSMTSLSFPKPLYPPFCT